MVCLSDECLGGLLGADVREVAGTRGRTWGTLGIIAQTWRFCSERSGESPQGSGHRNDVIQLLILKESLWLPGGINSWEVGKSRSKETSWDAFAKGEMRLTWWKS